MNSSNSLEYLCKCSMGYKGNNCQTPLTQCDLYSPCLNGATCVDSSNSNGYICQCAIGFTGQICQTNIEILRHADHICYRHL